MTLDLLGEQKVPAEDKKRPTNSFLQDMVLVRTLFESSGLFSRRELEPIPGKKQYQN